MSSDVQQVESMVGLDIFYNYCAFVFYDRIDI